MRLIALFAFLAVLLDQVSKYVVIHTMELARVGTIQIFPPLLNFIYGENRGINFGLFDNGDSRWLLVGLAVAICVGVVWWMSRAPQGALALTSAGLLIGGALGNVIDRLWYGYVLDFLNMSCCGINNPFVFNVADIFIFAGALGVAFFSNDAKSDKKRA